ncbi:uncharacterized protein AKAW2_50363S [Aspergillus luchuensis]|uniref:Uncharacterized protein n=1 Tax=Aspergillus kawachii TaxID=1069201 RepID=A0A7R7WBQ6_ASPKA|nr:uncharacterized protein AKAW2_50363S [Aspergillus luchuensis]BCS00022.1 hypothetical protein AKAW2_50363S [Aspergillus luchuensis]
MTQTTSRVLGNSLRFASDKQSASRYMPGKSIACCIMYSTFRRVRTPSDGPLVRYRPWRRVMLHRASKIARLVTAWGGDLATMRQPSDTWANQNLRIRESRSRWVGNGQIIRQDYRSGSRDELYDNDQVELCCVRQTQNSPLVLAGA